MLNKDTAGRGLLSALNPKGESPHLESCDSRGGKVEGIAYPHMEQPWDLLGHSPFCRSTKLYWSYI
jgi:hypothetical protein